MYPKDILFALLCLKTPVVQHSSSNALPTDSAEVPKLWVRARSSATTFWGQKTRLWKSQIDPIAEFCGLAREIGQKPTRTKNTGILLFATEHKACAQPMDADLPPGPRQLRWGHSLGSGVIRWGQTLFSVYKCDQGSFAGSDPGDGKVLLQSTK